MTGDGGRDAPDARAAAEPNGLLARVFWRLTRPPVLTVAAALLLGTVYALGAVNIATTDGPRHPDGTPCCGDFAAFWTGGWFVAEGQGERLYDVDVQAAFQAELLGGTQWGWQPYLYPPTFALVVAPAVPFGYRAAFAWFGLVGVVALAGAFWALWPRLERWGPVGRATGLMMVASYAPVPLTLVGGQSSGLVLAIWTAHYAAVCAGRAAWAGVFLGLLCAKPQFVLLPAAWHLLRRDGRTLAAAAATGVVQWALGALAMGPQWPVAFLGAIRALSLRRGWEGDAPRFLSLPASWGWSFGPTGTAAAWVIVALLVGALAWLGRNIREDDASFPVFYATLLVLAVLGAPHAMYYDHALMALPMLLVCERAGSTLPDLARWVVGVCWLGYPMFQLAPQLGLQPLTWGMLVAVLGGLWALSRSRRGASPSVAMDRG